MAVRVLIADDSSSARALLRFHMELFGYKVVGEAANGAEAVALFKSLRPDVVTLDVFMPADGGVDTLTALRLMKKEDPTVPIIVVSAVPFDRTRETFLEAGAFDYVVKPFNKFYLNETRRKLERAFPRMRQWLRARTRRV